MLSLDICVGVVGSAALAQSVMKAPLRAALWVLLPLSVWAIYTADHLFDARKDGPFSSNARHQFHYRNFYLLATLVGISVLICLAGAFFFFREAVFSAGLLIGGLSVFHLLVAYWGRIRFGKELSVGLIYSCGVWFVPWLNRSVAIGWFELAFMFLFLVAAWLNLFMNSVVEFIKDKKDGQLFGLGFISRERMRYLVVFISLVSALMALSLAVFDNPVSCVVLACLCAVPGIILFAERFFTINARYRLLAEWVFAAGLLVKI